METHPRATLPALLLSTLVALLIVARQYGVVALGLPPRTFGALVPILWLGSFLLVPVGVFVVGFWAGRGVDLRSSRWSLFGTLLVAGFVGYLVGTGVGVAATVALSPEFVARNLASVLVSSGLTVVTGAVDAALAGFAGAALASLGQSSAASE